MSKRVDAGKGPSQRQLRVGEVVRRALAEALMRGEAHEPALAGRSITVSGVRMSPDLRNATAYVMPLGGHDREGALAALHKARGQLRHVVDRATDLKRSPQLEFRIDESFDRMDETRAMLDRPEVKRDL